MSNASGAVLSSNTVNVTGASTSVTVNVGNNSRGRYTVRAVNTAGLSGPTTTLQGRVPTVAPLNNFASSSAYFLVRGVGLATVTIPYYETGGQHGPDDSVTVSQRPGPNATLAAGSTVTLVIWDRTSCETDGNQPNNYCYKAPPPGTTF